MSEREPSVLGKQADADESGEERSDAVAEANPANSDDETARMTFPAPMGDADEGEDANEGADEDADEDEADEGADEDDQAEDGAISAEITASADQTRKSEAPPVTHERASAAPATLQPTPGPKPAPKPAPTRRRREAPVFRVAGFWRRLAAAAIDLAIILPVALALSWVAGKAAGVHLPPSRHRGLDFWLDLFLASDPALFGAIGLTLAIATVYILLFQVTMAQTPGMRALKTRIIDVYGDPPAIGRAATRTVGYLVGIATLGLGFLWIGFDSEKRGLHDWLSRTYVVKL